jgi:hypothetical protein
MSAMPVIHAADQDPDQHEHVVVLYETEQVLASAVVSFLAPALLLDEALLVVATPLHRGLFTSALTAAGADLPALRQSGRYIELDAEQTLAALLPDGRLSRFGFDATVGKQVRSLSREHGRVHIYGEMVACLWGRGDAAAALELESLWNDLADNERFRLCCAYPKSLLAVDDPQVGDMLDAHSLSTWLDA